MLCSPLTFTDSIWDEKCLKLKYFNMLKPHGVLFDVMSRFESNMGGGDYIPYIIHTTTLDRRSKGKQRGFCLLLIFIVLLAHPPK